MKGRCNEREAWGKRNIIVLRHWKLDKSRNTKMNSLSLVNRFFLGHYRDYKTFRISPQPTPPAEFLGDGVAQSIKAVQLDR